MDHAITAFITGIVTFIATLVLVVMVVAAGQQNDVKAGVTIVGSKAYRLVLVEPLK